MGKASRRKQTKQPPATPPTPSSGGYTLSPLKLFAGSLLLLAAGFTAGVLVQSSLGPSQPALNPPPAESVPRVDLLQQLDASRAIEQFKAHLEHAPEDLETRIELGNALFDAGRYPDAIAQYQLVLEKQHRNADVRTDMGIALRRSGRSDLAAAAFRRVIQDVPDHVNAHFNLGVVLANDLDDPGGAITAWERFLELAPNAPNASQIRSTLQQLKTRR